MCPGGRSVFLLGSVSLISAFYVPGNAPNAYESGAMVPIEVNKLTSSRTQVPYGYYSLDFCKPNRLHTSEENLGQILKGDLIQNTPYIVRMNVDDACQILCRKNLTEESINAFKGMISDEYYVNLLADDLPAALTIRREANSEDDVTPGSENKSEYAVGGYPIGFKSGQDKLLQYLLINHLDMTIRFHPTAEGSRVVGFSIEPFSIKHDPKAADYDLSCDAKRVDPVDLERMVPGDTITYTYSVRFVYSNIDWATRWDAYLMASPDNERIHWFSIVNAFVVVVLLSALVATILLRTLLRDIARYNNLTDIEDAQEESGWKLVHADVFRRPNFSKLLATCTGTGVQVLIMIGLTLGFAMLGVLSPANRGALLQVMLTLFAFMGGPAGYISARFNKLFQGEEIHRSVTVTLWTAFHYTGVCFTTFLTLNIILYMKKSSGAIPFSYIFLLVLLWLGVSVPLVFVGAYMGYRKPAITVPVRTNQIPRQIPRPPFFIRPWVGMMAGGILPFGAVFSELTFIMASVWQHRFYYLFGFLTLVMIILIITCAEASIVFTYFQLVAEDYRWWWRSYWVSAFSSVYVLLFSIVYFYTSLEITHFASVLLYFSYSALMAYTFFLVTGAIGFIATFWFVRAIYGAVKVD